MSAASERSFLSESEVTVTQARLVVAGQTYAMNGITSVASFKISPSRKLPIVLIAMGVMGLLSGDSSAIPGGLLFFLVGAVWLYLKQPRWVVSLRSSSGESRVLESSDRVRIEGIIQAINEAIIARG